MVFDRIRALHQEKSRRSTCPRTFEVVTLSFVTPDTYHGLFYFTFPYTCAFRLLFFSFPPTYLHFACSSHHLCSTYYTLTNYKNNFFHIRFYHFSRSVQIS